MTAFTRVLGPTISLLVALAPVAAWSEETKPTPTEIVTVLAPRTNTPAAANLEMHGDDSFGGNFVAIWPKAAYRIRADG